MSYLKHIELTVKVINRVADLELTAYKQNSRFLIQTTTRILREDLSTKEASNYLDGVLFGLITKGNDNELSTSI